ncbi:MAG TPA: oxidative damage protection protein [Chthonomonadales bacterium]|nr:oxidative damage protection protein [Chthonomonadales bacterium]
MEPITCARCGKSAQPLDSPPQGGALGEKIQNNVCAACWNEWLSQQVLFINHYGLHMADPEDRRKLTAAMKEFLNIG